MWNIHPNNNCWFCGYLRYPISRSHSQYSVEATNLKDKITVPRNTSIYLTKGLAWKRQSYTQLTSDAGVYLCIYFQRQVSIGPTLVRNVKANNDFLSKQWKKRRVRRSDLYELKQIEAWMSDLWVWGSFWEFQVLLLLQNSCSIKGCHNKNKEQVYESSKFKQVPYHGSSVRVKRVRLASCNKSPKASFHSIHWT